MLRKYQQLKNLRCFDGYENSIVPLKKKVVWLRQLRWVELLYLAAMSWHQIWLLTGTFSSLPPSLLSSFLLCLSTLCIISPSRHKKKLQKAFCVSVHFVPRAHYPTLSKELIVGVAGSDFLSVCRYLPAVCRPGALVFLFLQHLLHTVLCMCKVKHIYIWRVFSFHGLVTSVHMYGFLWRC